MQSNTLTESQCKIIKKYLPESERKRKHDLREIFDALFYILKTGCHWRMLPNNYPKWELVYYYYSKWRDEELFVHLNDMIRETVRIISNKRAQCSVAIIDSQSVKTTRRGGLRGVDGNKRIKGRKRHIMVDTMGNIITNVVHVANIHDSKGAYLVLKTLNENIYGIKMIYADCGYRGELIQTAKNIYNYELKISPKIKDMTKNFFIVFLATPVCSAILSLLVPCECCRSICLILFMFIELFAIFNKIDLSNLIKKRLPQCMNFFYLCQVVNLNRN